MNPRMPRITLIDLYKKYLYKCPDTSKEQGRNYISNKEINCNSEYSVDLKTYKDIINNCIKVLVNNYLLKGRIVTLPYSIGDLEIKKYKPKTWKSSGIDWKATNENIKNGNQKYVYYSLNHSEGYRWCLTWKKNKKSFSGQRFWRFHPHKSLRVLISKALVDNPLLINKFNTR